MSIYSSLTGFMALAVLFTPDTPVASHTLFAASALITFVAGATLVSIAGIWSAAGAFSTVLWLFHFSLLAALATGLASVDELTSWDRAWLLGPYGSQAITIATAGALAFFSGVGMCYAVRGQAGRAQQNSAPHSMPPIYGAGGGVLILGAVVMWFAVVLTSGGPALLLGSYGEYLDKTGNAPGVISSIWLALNIGVVLVLAGRGGRLRRVALGALGLLALVALPLGLRGELLFPAVGGLVAAARVGKQMPVWRTWLLALCVLAAIPLIREVRSVGLTGAAAVSLAPKLADAFIELGSSLHPVEKVIRWKAEGDPHTRGATYWAPFERAAARMLPGTVRVAAEEDDRIMNILVAERVGHIGFSPIAEAFRNFGGPGVLGVMLAIGLLIGLIDTIRRPTHAVLMLAVLFVPLLINVRNSFVSVPAQAGAAIAFLALLGMAAHVRRSVSPARRRSVQARPLVVDAR